MERYDIGDYVIEIGQGGAPEQGALALRAEVFRDGLSDQDAHDKHATHVVLSAKQGPLACLRMLQMASGQIPEQSYASQFYDLGRLAGFAGSALEIGRVCVSPNTKDPWIIRLLWSAITQKVLDQKIDFLFGCSSFLTIDAGEVSDGLSLLASEFSGPENLAPRPKAKETLDLKALPQLKNRASALRQIPPILKTYLQMGGWVSDHAVIDRDLGTIHVFTGLEIAKIPPARVASLMRDAGR